LLLISSILIFVILDFLIYLFIPIFLVILITFLQLVIGMSSTTPYSVDINEVLIWTMHTSTGTSITGHAAASAS
jgi:hypothetical protein